MYLTSCFSQASAEDSVTGTTTQWDPLDASPPTVENSGTKFVRSPLTSVMVIFCWTLCIALDALQPFISGQVRRVVISNFSAIIALTAKTVILLVSCGLQSRSTGNKKA